MNERLFEQLLDYYQISKEEYFNLNKPVSRDNFINGHMFDHINEAVELVNKHINEHSKIFVYGDYDADGIMGTSILLKMLQYVSYSADYYIPNRYKDGYAINLAKANEIIHGGYKLVICVDNGVAAVEPINLLRANNIDVLVLDHHERQDVLPDANVIIHPILDNFGETASSGAFTAFIFSTRFLNRYDKYLATMASISLISDMMPMRDYNRNLMRLVINEYIDGEFYQFDALKDAEPFNENTIGMKIAPKINSLGRLLDNDTINKIVPFFVEDNRDNLLEYLNWINEIYETRKAYSKEEAEKVSSHIEDSAALVFVCEAKEGLLGLIANTLVGKVQKPVIAMTLSDDGETYKGSARSPEGFNLSEAFIKLSNLLITGGGHAQSGGLSLKKENYELFKQEFIKLVEKESLTYVEKKTIDFSLSDLNMETYNFIQTFAPFGETWKAPLFKIHNLPTNKLFYSKNNMNIITNLGFNSKITGFGFSKEQISKFNFVDLIGTLRTSTYMGKTSVEFLISEAKESKF